MKQKPSFIKENQAKPVQKPEPIKPQEPAIVNQKSKVNEGFEINYIIITAPDAIKLATAVNYYIGKFPFMIPAGGVCYIGDNGQNEVAQALRNKDL